MSSVDFSNGMFFFTDYGVVFRDIVHFCENENLEKFIARQQDGAQAGTRLHVFYKGQRADARYALGYLTSKLGSKGFEVEFHRYDDNHQLGELIADLCTIYIPANMDDQERALVSCVYEYGLKVIWGQDDIDEMNSFDEPFDPGEGKYFSKRLHDKGRLWYAIVEVQPDFVDRIKVGYGSKFYRPYISRSGDAKIYIGRGSYISDKPRFFLDADFSLGSYCQVSTDFTAISRRHAITNLSLGHLSGGGMGFFGEGEDLSKSTIVKNDVWIGTKVILMPGVTVENGCVIGAGSVVTKDCEPFGIYAGNPARLVRYRFPKEKIDLLLESEWWNWSLSKVWSKREIFLNKVDELDVSQMREMLEL